MTIREIVAGSASLLYNPLCSALIERFGVKQTVKWDSVLPHEQQQTLFGGEILRLISEHPTLANQKEIRPVCLMKGELSQLLFFYVQLKDEKLPKAVIEKITRKFVGGAAADRYIIWFFGSKTADALKIVISGKEGKKIRLKTLSLEAGQWFKTYDYILSEVERKFNTGGLFQEFKEPSGLWKALWDAFDISIVNKKFYAEIKAVFDELTREELPKCKGLLTNEQDRVQFAIRLIGLIIFCWFLKRKGIITGDVMSSRAVEAEQNYYRDLLEPLFFDVFNTPLNERRKDLPASIRNYPFLNGGLFEPQLHDHKGNWALNISNNWFINFFNNTLERYNFTVDENSAASSEIAIDPEMLGRIFENLLAEQNPETGESARKSTGSYYTPREIVDFMVEESLIAYLKTTPSPSSPPLKGGESTLSPSPLEGEGKGEGAIEDFVHTGTLPDALKSYRRQLFEKLNAIKVLDPACGSGAFPISMLQKLAALKYQLDPKASPYALKLKTIENSIYGVDIQPMATELSRLRCWLSLIVDEDPKEIKPLPNLDFKFVTANSLIDLGYDEFIQKVETGKAPALFLQDFKNKLAELRTVRQKYFDPLMGQKGKDRLKKEFNTISVELLNMSHKLITLKLLDADFANKINSWEPFDDSRPAPFFNKSWMFGVEEGFDIVIGNPPYGIIFDDVLKSTYESTYPSFARNNDIYVAFYEKGVRLLKNLGQLVFISPNTFLNGDYFKIMRKFLTKETTINEIVDYKEVSVFDDPTVFVCVFICTLKKPVYPYLALINTAKGSIASFIRNIFIIKHSSDEPFKPGNLIIEKIQHDSQFCVLDDLFLIKDIGFNYWTKGKGKKRDGNSIGDRVFYNGPRQHPDDIPFLKGRDLTKWQITKPTNYLKHNYESFLDEPDTFRFSAEFLERKPKIVYRQTASTIIAAIDDTGCYLDKTVHLIVPKTNWDNYSAKFLSGLLNSRLFDYLYAHISQETEGRAFAQVKTTYIKKLLIPKVPKDTSIERIIDQILAAKQKDPQADTSALEKQIDEMVYKLYALTQEEIALVEGKGNVP